MFRFPSRVLVALWLAASCVFAPSRVAAQLIPATSSDQPEGATLALPDVGSAALRILSPTVLELSLVNTQPSGGTPASWNFVTGGVLTAPPASAFRVAVNDQPVAITSVGFKRRARSAPLGARDLRIANFLYLVLAQPLAPGAMVVVTNPDGTLWSASVNYAAIASPLRHSPVVHVNHEGYLPGRAKRAPVGYYLGSLGELAVAPGTSFSLIDQTGTAVFSGTLTARPEQGSNLTPPPYQRVCEADFTGYDTPGRYRLRVDGLGMSLPFRIDAALGASAARTYALGLYHQRCGGDNAMPFTRFVHGVCHAAAAQVPDLTALFNTTNGYIASFAGAGPAQIAPVLVNVAASLFPFVRTGTVAVSGGHHDAGDYSRYMVNCGQLVHALCFAADNFPGAAALDNLGLPESGDGKSDVLQLAKWEADYLVRAQDADGGFYAMIYPRDRKYEGDVTPDHGDTQVVWPKTTLVTAVATAALAQMATSPAFRQQFPADAAAYDAAARRGWAFLQSAWAARGRDGAFQYIHHYGSTFGQADEIAWCEAEMFLLTGDPAIHAQLLADFDPASAATVKWGWMRMFEGYGCAARAYAFAASSGRIAASSLDATMLAKCQQQVLVCAQDQLAWASGSAYGVSYPYPDKRYGNAAWFHAMSRAFDLAVAHALQPSQTYLDGILSNLNFELGSNPNNVSFLAGTGWLRPRFAVNQYQNNARRHLPPSGIPIGSMTATMPIVGSYGSELRNLSFPADANVAGAYAMYDRWTDTWNVQSEIVTYLAARGLAATLPLMLASPVAGQPYRALTATITGVASSVPVNTALTPRLSVSGVDLTGAMIVWDSGSVDPIVGGTSCSLTPRTPGASWLEAEALLPDGRRAFAMVDFTVATSNPTSTALALTPSATQVATGAPLSVSVANDAGGASDWVGLYAVGGTSYLSWLWMTGTQSQTGPRVSTLAFTAPAAAGTYEFRYIRSGAVLARSAAVTVTAPVAPPAAPTLTLSAPQVGPGGTVRVTIGNDTGATGDWVGLYPVGGASYVAWLWMTGTQSQTGPRVATLTFTAPTTLGSYEFRLMNAGAIKARSATLSVAPLAPALTVAQTQVAPGAALAVSLANDTGDPADWVGLYPVGGTNYVAWLWMTGTQSQTGPRVATLNFVAPATTGSYEFRLMNNGTVKARSASVTVAVVAPVLTLSTTSTAPGGSIQVDVANDPGGASDWVGLYPAGGTNYVAWLWMTGTQSQTGPRVARLSFTAPAAAGSYEFRYRRSSATLATSPRFAVAAP